MRLGGPLQLFQSRYSKLFLGSIWRKIFKQSKNCFSVEKLQTFTVLYYDVVNFTNPQPHSCTTRCRHYIWWTNMHVPRDILYVTNLDLDGNVIEELFVKK